LFLLGNGKTDRSFLGSDIVASWVGTCQFRLAFGGYTTVLGKMVVV